MTSARQAPAVPASGLRTMSILYFIYFAGTGVFFTYVNVYYRSLGFSGTQIGIIGTLGPLFGMLGLTVFRVLNDRGGQTRRLLMAALGGAALTALAIGGAPGFLLIVPLACAYALLVNPVIPLLDSTTLRLLASSGERYGSYRIWGTVGFIVTTATVGAILERAGIGRMFVLYALVIACMLVAVRKLPVQAVHLGGFSVRGVGRMLRQPALLVFVGSVFFLGLSFSGLFTFLSVVMSAMGASQTMIGVAWTMAAVSEIPIMLFSATLLRRVGAQRLVVIAFFMYAVRNMCYAAMPGPVWVVAINGVFGASYGLFWIGAVSYISALAPPGLRTTAQSLLTSTTSLANVAGALLSGWLFDQIGPSGLFRVMAIFSLIAFLLLLAGQRVTGREAVANNTSV